MSGVLAPGLLAQPVGRHGDPAEPAEEMAISVATFLDRVAGVLRAGLPARAWIAATVVDARASATGHTLELSDPALERGVATLRVFLATSTLAAIRRDLGVPVDPMLLVGMTTCLRIAPSFSRRWHLGGRIEALSREVATSLRARLTERIIATLKHEKLWDRQRGLPRPRDITRIAVIHPMGAAGWADIANELGRWEKAGLVRVRSHPTRFEGDGAVAAIVAALRDAAQPIDEHRADLVLMCRGGGARISLAALDEDPVARAILSCPVPVVSGTGHAHDLTLTDRVVWRATDTPSKALGLVAGFISDAARAAQADRAAVLSIGATMVATYQRQLEARQASLLACLERTAVASRQQLAALWSEVRITATRRREHMARLGDGASELLRTVLVSAPAAIEAEDRMLQRVIGESLDRAWRIVGRQDGGVALLAAIDQAAHARLDRHETMLMQLRDRLVRDADHRLRDAEVTLAQLHAVLDGLDITVILRRGFAIVTDPAGKLLPTRASASGSVRLVVHFADGAMEATPDCGDDPPA